MNKIKTVICGILIGAIAFPAVALGGSFVSSLIQGKTVEEAVQILAEQIDSLIGRVETIETKQEAQVQAMVGLGNIVEQQQAEAMALENTVEQQQAEVMELESVIEQQQVELENQRLAFESQKSKQELWQEQEEACKYAEKLNHAIPPMPEGVRGGMYNSSCEEFIQSLNWPGFYPRPSIAKGNSLDTIEAIYNYEKSCTEHPDHSVITPIYDQYIQAKQKCEELTAQYDSLSQ